MHLPQLVFSLLLAGLIGCGQSGPTVVPVHGKVTYRGKPVAFGTVLFQPATTEGHGARPAVGAIQEDGTYELRAYPNRKGASPGEYRVAVDAYTGSHLSGNVKYAVPKRYADARSSGLVATVPATGTNEVTCDFELVD